MRACYNLFWALKAVFLSPGRGPQPGGRGRALADTCPAARRIFEEADRALGFCISRLCFEGPEDQLKLTENTQPALLSVSIAAFEVLKERGLSPDYVAAHSLRQYSPPAPAASPRL